MYCLSFQEPANFQEKNMYTKLDFKWVEVYKTHLYT